MTRFYFKSVLSWDGTLPPKVTPSSPPPPNLTRFRFQSVLPEDDTLLLQIHACLKRHPSASSPSLSGRHICTSRSYSLGTTHFHFKSLLFCDDTLPHPVHTLPGRQTSTSNPYFSGTTRFRCQFVIFWDDTFPLQISSCGTTRFHHFQSTLSWTDMFYFQSPDSTGMSRFLV